MLMWDKALIEPSEREYSRDWTRGRAQELESRFPEFSSKLSDVQNWGALDEEAKDNLADAFLAFFNTYPEYADAAKNDNREYAIELADAITQDMRTGKMILLEDVLVDSDTHAVELRMGSRNKEHWNREYTPSLYGDRGDRFDYLMDISRTLAALWK